LTIASLQQGYKDRLFSVTEVVKDYLNRLDKLEPKLKAFLAVQPETALARATELDRAWAGGKAIGPLGGVPVAVKDVIITKGLTTTAASRSLAHYVPPYQSTVVSKILSAGAIILGKTNCDEFAMGASTENSGFYPTFNPWDTTRVPGGSSGGSAAAVAAGQAMVALGTDTGGSIRQPAAFCGVVGIKPTYGRVSRYGLIAMASSLDQAGPLARNVGDAARVLTVMAGADEYDATASQTPVPDYAAELGESVKNLRVGVPQEFFAEGINKPVAQTVRDAIDVLTGLGAKVSAVSIPSMAYALAAYYVMAPAEVSANLARYDGLRFGEQIAGHNLMEVYTKTRGQLFGNEVKRRIMLGTYVLSSGYYEAYYRQALKVKELLKADLTRVWREFDMLATPTTPTVAFPFGSRINDPLAMYLADVYTVPANIAGLPAVSVPCGFVDKMPVGLQLIGSVWSEGMILRMAYAYEQATTWHNYKPSISE